ncbi:MAG: hypothetical protein GTO14_03365 [Anaerolineales bacterium]|nr:hypothetical protein [Anaerolineales bacterium]
MEPFSCRTTLLRLVGVSFAFSCFIACSAKVEPEISENAGSNQIMAVEQDSQSLSGDWRFGVDRDNVGEQEEWFSPGYVASDWLLVEVPHTWNVMEAYRDYVGISWYRRDFTPEADISGAHIRLHFDAVYYKATVWLNGTLLGEHEGGYTPFEFDVSDLVVAESQNALIVKVDNYRKSDRVPDDVFDWWPYGGIVRNVTLIVTSRTYIDQQFISTVPNITGWNEADEASVSTSVSVRNTSADRLEGFLRATVIDDDTGSTVFDAPQEIRINVPAGESVEITLNAVIPSPKLWHFDNPNLYIWDTTLLDNKGRVLHSRQDTFGARLIELINGHFILNGEPVRLVGMSRHVDSPQYGLAEPLSFMVADYDDMKRLNMVFSRPVHYPQDETVYDYCDRNGILLIPEIPAWQIDRLWSRDTQETAAQQLTEMIIASFNHPSIWAWSVGNELDSNTPRGREYVSLMVSLAHELDPTRPVGFASYQLWSNQARDATAITDFVMMNEYAGSWAAPKESLAEALDQIHGLWPDRVVMISEFGLESEWTSAPWMGDTTWMNNDSYYYIEPGLSPFSEEVYRRRSQVVFDQMEIFRSRPYVAGAIFWTYQDYRSGGGFIMGIVDEYRDKSPVWDEIRAQYSPIRDISVTSVGDDAFAVEFVTRGPLEEDMPVYTLRGYSLVWEVTSLEGYSTLTEGQVLLPDLSPAAIWADTIEIDMPEEDYLISFRIKRPTGFDVWEQTFNAQGEVVE